MLKGKKVVVYISGGIAVYKIATLVRLLIKKGAEVQVAMTDSAQTFVTPLTFEALSKHHVYVNDDLYEAYQSDQVSHIHLADWADFAIVAPATANLIGKMANGIADDFVSSALIATKAPKWVAPAMNENMYNNPAMQRNLTQLKADGLTLIEPEEGFLAEGYSGKGRLPEPETILSTFERTIRTEGQADFF